MMRDEVERRLSELDHLAIFFSDFADIGSSSRLNYCLNQLIEENLLVRISRGIYARATPSLLDIHQPVMTASFGDVVLDALTRLGVRWEEGRAERAYRTGRTTQVPVRRSIRLHDKVNRLFKYQGHIIHVENGPDIGMPTSPTR